MHGLQAARVHGEEVTVGCWRLRREEETRSVGLGAAKWPTQKPREPIQ
jgi:hypothetical protein